jgi:hypothetical protein
MLSQQMTKSRRPSTPYVAGTHCIWPRGVELRYGISRDTRIRWERKGVLPARDVFLNGRPKGWQPATLEAADRGKSSYTP